MDHYFLIAGFIMFLCVIGVYLYFCIVKSSQTPNLGDGVSLFLSSNGIAVGIKVAYLGLTVQLLANNQIYILLGGLAVIWVSIETILKTIKR